MLFLMIPIYVVLWIIAAHIQYLMRNENKQDKFWIYPVYSMIAISFAKAVAMTMQ